MSQAETPAAAAAEPQGQPAQATPAAKDSTAGGDKGTLPLLNDQYQDQDGKGQDGQPDDSPAAAKPGTGAAASPLAPEAYDVTLPEGMEANPELLKEFQTLAAQHGIPPEAARKMLDLEVKNQQALLGQFNQRQEAWKAEITNDSEFGGDNLPVTVQQAQRALKTYDPSGTLIAELTRGGYGNHPGVIRFLARVGKGLKEDTAHTGREQKTDNTPLRDRMWPDDVMPS